MKRMTAVLGAAAFVLATSLVFAQTHPSFAGKWTRAEDPTAAPAGGGGGRGGFGRGGFGQEVTITQDASTITLEWTQGQNAQKRVYKLDGSESVNEVMGRGGEPMSQTSKATWDGAKLVITTTTQVGETSQALSMSGADLVVEQTGGRGGATSITYKKAM
jgi:Spy/CpxP family protein refolding chaperone